MVETTGDKIGDSGGDNFKSTGSAGPKRWCSMRIKITTEQVEGACREWRGCYERDAVN
jgi:hypothetical protein